MCPRLIPNLARSPRKVSNLWEIPTVIVDEDLDKAIERASFEKLADGIWYAEIEGFQGLWASGHDQDAFRRTLREVLVDWLSHKLRDGDRDIPAPAGIGLPMARGFPGLQNRHAGGRGRPGQ
jgi:predicted RNase H-like HicB family nuclease